MSKDRVIICMKWGTLYGPEYVNVLYNACRENIEGDFKFVCLTDDDTGIQDQVMCHPIPDLGLSEANWKKGGWPKLAVFKEDFFGLTGTALFIDLDMVITGPLDAFFEHKPGKIVTVDNGRNWKFGGDSEPREAGTMIFKFDLQKHSDILTTFLGDVDGAVKRTRIEQAYLQDVYPDIEFWPKDWVISFKYHLRQPVLRGLFLQPHAPKHPNKVLAFHGEPRPIDLVNGGLWGIGPHWGLGRVKWMVDYWRRHGGEA
jgi:hypothetical protein